MNAAKKILADNGWKDTNNDGVVEKGTLKAAFNLLYPSSDVTRQSLAIASADMLKPLGIQVKAEGKSWDDLEKQMHANPVLLDGEVMILWRCITFTAVNTVEWTITILGTTATRRLKDI